MVGTRSETPTPVEMLLEALVLVGVFYVFTVAFDAVFSDESWAEAARSNVAGAAIFTVVIVLSSYCWPRWRSWRGR